MIKRISVVATCCLASMLAFARFDSVPQVLYPTLTKAAASAQGFVPKGWKLERVIKTELNGDRRPDLLMLLQQYDPKNIVPNPNGLGVDPLNSNPRMLAVAFGQTRGYKLMTQNHTVIPRRDSPTIDDPFDGLSSKDRKFKVEIGFFASAGSWTVLRTSFLFRYQNGCFRLIGFDSIDFHRASSEFTEISVNYLNARVKTTKGVESKGEQRTTWSRLKKSRIICIEDVGNGYEFDPLLETK
jgi:hypothetical protein